MKFNLGKSAYEKGEEELVCNGNKLLLIAIKCYRLLKRGISEAELVQKSILLKMLYLSNY